MKKKNFFLKKKIIKKSRKALIGNNRSFSMISTKKVFSTNLQKFKINSKSYKMPVKNFKSYWKKKIS